MSFEKAKAYLESLNLGSKIQQFDVSSATVELAAQALGCEPMRIAKTLSFKVHGQAILIVLAGDAKLDNHKYKQQFGVKATMLAPEEVEEQIGHTVGGVCPFGANPDVKVYLDLSLRRFETVFPACGSANSCVELTLPELERASGNPEWIDVGKNWQSAEG